MKKRWKILILIIFILISIILTIRANSSTEIDDVASQIDCDEKYLEKVDVLWVIPKFQNTPISEDTALCEYLLDLNKTLGMHGIYHSHKEFNNYVNETELQEAKQIFKECFGFEPELFKPPQLEISRENKKILKKNNLKTKGRFNQLIHKVYHCDNTGTFSNGFHDIF